MPAKKTPDELLQEANNRLKQAKVRVAIAPKKQSLFLRATLPPKPGSSKTSPHSQWIAVGAYLNPAGIQKAEAEAMRLHNDLFYERFDWANWLKRSPLQPEPAKTKTVADWLTEFEKHYFTKRDRNPKSETTWDKDYRLPLLRIPQHRVLTAELLIETVQIWEPDTRSRQRGCDAFGRLAKFAGIEVSMTEYRGSYSPKAVNPRDLPDDDSIIQAIESLQDERWRFLAALMAVYGLRDHEVFYVDLPGLRQSPGICEVTDGKTGWRQVWPYEPDWWERFNLNGPIVLPALTARKNTDYGVRISQYFKRKEMPFKPYDLRHAWAARTAVHGLDPAIAAKMMGHDLQTHTRVYHQFISKSSLQAAWERSQRKRD